ncbi:MAG TPA: prepilin-type N-terminal cleavage/methylation domain-containing protein [Candidatus Saccharimonadia bacterium]|nr:prepilin-type N-terminal cleavage/methylation domain-containing protein [Candidatus Saccharimonadia bacterium]
MLHRNQAGYTLIELLVVIVITTAIAVPLSLFAIKGLTSYNFLEAQSNTALELNILTNRIAKVVRGATSVDTAQSNTLIVYGYFSPQDTTIKKIRYFISGTNLNIGVTPPTGTAPNYIYDSANEVITTTRIDLVMGGKPLFTYYDDAGNQLSGAFATSQIKNVGIYVAANPNAKQVPIPISLTTRVTLRNLKTNL